MTSHTARLSAVPLYTRAVGLLCGLFVSCGSLAAPSASASPANTRVAPVAQTVESRIWMTVRDRRFSITLADTKAAREFAAMLPLSIDMPDLNDNEKHAQLPKSLPTDTVRPGTIRSGDLMLYGSRTLVAFYLSFPSPYTYTRLGRVDDPKDLAQVFGSETVRIVFSRD